jgi:putative flavoprotein involved in K+ transport
MTETVERVETIVIGGGQAGLSAAYHLTRRGRECVVLDANERIGDQWRSRWPTLRLYSPAKYDSLPGLPFPAPRQSFPLGLEFADYLEGYAARFELSVRTGVRVDRLSQVDGRYVVEAGERRFEADNVVVANGAFRTPALPEFAAELDPRIRQLHSSEYRGPSQLQDGPALVVGASHSGGDIAFELAAAHETTLCGRDTGQIPVPLASRRMRVLWPVLRFLATRVLTVRTPLGRKMRPEVRSHGGPLLRVRKSDLAAAGVERVYARVVGVRDGRPLLEDGRVLDVANVVWCTGFRPDYGWIDLPLEHDDGYPRQRHGAVGEQPGLYFLGLLFLHSFSSMLILGAGRDARRVARHIASRRPESRAVTRSAARSGGVGGERATV